MPTTQEIVKMQRLAADTGWRYRLKPWESLVSIKVTESVIQVVIDTYEVTELVREDRYSKKGRRGVMLERKPNGKWVVEFDHTRWDEDFVPFVYEKFGRRDTAEELIARREWEMLCHRPGTARTPLDSYERVLQGGYTESEKRIERHF